MSGLGFKGLVGMAPRRRLVAAADGEERHVGPGLGVLRIQGRRPGVGVGRAGAVAETFQSPSPVEPARPEVIAHGEDLIEAGQRLIQAIQPAQAQAAGVQDRKVFGSEDVGPPKI